MRLNCSVTVNLWDESQIRMCSPLKLPNLRIFLLSDYRYFKTRFKHIITAIRPLWLLTGSHLASMDSYQKTFSLSSKCLQSQWSDILYWHYVCSHLSLPKRVIMISTSILNAVTSCLDATTFEVTNVFLDTLVLKSHWFELDFHTIVTVEALSPDVISLF